MTPDDFLNHGFPWAEFFEERWPDDFCSAVGRMALSFATFEYALVTFLLLADYPNGEWPIDKRRRLSNEGLKTKLNRMTKVLEAAGIEPDTKFFSIARMNDLAEDRNDIMHGLSLEALSTDEGFPIWNPGHERPAKLITRERIETLTSEIQVAANKLAILDVTSTKTPPPPQQQ